MNDKQIKKITKVIKWLWHLSVCPQSQRWPPKMLKKTKKQKNKKNRNGSCSNHFLVCSFSATVETCGAWWRTLWKRTRSLCRYKFYSGLLLERNTTVLDLRSSYNNSIVFQYCLWIPLNAQVFARWHIKLRLYLLNISMLALSLSMSPCLA